MFSRIENYIKTYLLYMNESWFVKLKKTKNYKNVTIYALICSVMIFFVIVSMVARPEKYIAVTINSLIVWATVVLPSLFPFLIYTKFLTKLGFVDLLSKLFSPITKKLFNVDGVSSYLWIMSIMSGNPIGAKLTADLYNEGMIDRGSAKRCITFCSNCGPMFIIGTVGIGFLLSKTAGYVMLLSHLLGSLLNGLTFRKKDIYDTQKKSFKEKNISTDNFFNQTAISSANSMFVVGTYIIFFFILIEFLVGLFSINTNTVFGSILTGFLEITHGCKDIALLNLNINLKTILATFVLSFGGLATAFQAFAFIKEVGISMKFYLFQKLTHCLYSTAICTMLTLIISI